MDGLWMHESQETSPTFGTNVKPGGCDSDWILEHQKIFRKLDSPELGRKTEIILLYQSFGIIIGGLWMQDTVQF